MQDLLTASVGTNLGVDFLPGSLGYDGSQPPSPDLAERIIWLDALTANVDRTWTNPNLLVWHGQTYAIDHGAALYFHHSLAEPDALAGTIRGSEVRREPARAGRRRRRRRGASRRARCPRDA